MVENLFPLWFKYGTCINDCQEDPVLSKRVLTLKSV